MDKKLSSLETYFPWRLSSTEMRPNILLMCKMLWVLLVLNGFYSMINDPFIPFILWFDNFNNYPGLFKYSLRSGFVIFGILLFLNIKPKLSSLIIGIIIILTLVASKTLFRNHIFIVGCIFFLAGLTDKKGFPWLLVIQISLVYFGASLNKALQLDWWTGQFMHNWLENAVENPIYIYISDLLPKLWFAKFLSWSAIFVELIIAITLLFRKWRKFGVWLIIIFHFSMFTIIGTRFGHFIEDIFIVLFVFLEWPEKRIFIGVDMRRSHVAVKLLKFLDWDSLFVWKNQLKNKNHWLEIDYKKTKILNFHAFKFLLLFSEGFYILLFTFNYATIQLMKSIEPLIGRILVHFIFVIIIWVLIVLFIPINLRTKRYNYSLYRKKE